MPLTLDQYDREVGHHLHMIRHHAMRIEMHVAYMTRQPHFETIAEDDLKKIGVVLAETLERVVRATASFREKPRDD